MLLNEDFNYPKNVLQASRSFGAGVTQTDNEIKYIMKVIKSLETRGILLKETTRKITSQKGGVLIPENAPTMETFFVKLQAQAFYFNKSISIAIFFTSRNFRNNFFIEPIQTTTSVFLLTFGRYLPIDLVYSCKEVI